MVKIKLICLFSIVLKINYPKPTSLIPKMSAIEISNVAASATVEKKPRAPRKPTLPAKYQKFMVFGFSMLRSLQESGALSEEALEAAYSAQLKLFGALDDQTAFYQGFLDGCSAQTKVMKKFVADRNKPPRKARAKKEQDPDAPKKERKPRAKKEVTIVSDAADNIIAELTNAALEVPVVADSDVKVKKPRAPRKPKADAAAPSAVDVIPQPVAPIKDAKETKSKATKSKATKEPKPKASAKTVAPVATVLTNDADHDDDDDDDEVILTRETVVDGKPFLIDQHNNLYDPVSHAFLRQI
jgi:hypothetical protein